MAREDVAALNGQNQPPSAAMPQDAAPPQAQGASQPASPEEQAQYDRFVSRAMELTYDKKVMPRVIEMLRDEEDPGEGLARATVSVVSRIMAMAEESGQQIGDDVLFHATTEVFEDIAELSREAGIKDYSQDRDALEGAYFRMLDQMRVALQQSGRISPEEAEAAMQQLQQMDESGELKNMMTRLAEEDEAGQGGEPGMHRMPNGSMMRNDQVPQRSGLMSEAK